LSVRLNIGFGKARLTEALDLSAAPAPPPANKTDASSFAIERKFDLTDRVQGLWRPDEAGPRRIVEDLWVRAMAGEDEAGPFVVLCFDLCEFAYQRVELFRRPLCAKLGYKPERVLCLPTHCHMTVKFHDHKLQALVLQAVLATQILFHITESIFDRPPSGISFDDVSGGRLQVCGEEIIVRFLPFRIADNDQAN
jgi:hypothetical protein